MLMSGELHRSCWGNDQLLCLLPAQGPAPSPRGKRSCNPCASWMAQMVLPSGAGAEMGRALWRSNPISASLSLTCKV